VVIQLSNAIDLNGKRGNLLDGVYVYFIFIDRRGSPEVVVVRILWVKYRFSWRQYFGNLPIGFFARDPRF
jgi:hypothetical protein